MNAVDDANLAQIRAAEAIEQIRFEIEKSGSLRRSDMEANLERSLQVLRQRASINAHWGLVPTWPVLGRFEVLGKRAMRILLRWYINPIVEQQNQFNLAIIAAIHEIEAQVHSISLDIEAQQRDTPRDKST